MKKTIQSFFSITILITLLLFACAARNEGPISAPAAGEADFDPDNPVEVWAVLAAKDDYSDVGMTDLLVEYIDLKRMRDALVSLGWDLEQIHSLKGFDQSALQAELEWLQENADENDLVFFYVTAHGKYLRDNILWNSFVPEEWAKIPSSNRVLVVDSCSAAEFINSIKGDPNPHLSIAAVDDDEYGWKGLEEEGLPIIGGIFTFYFAEALVDTLADANGDGLVSVQEAALAAEDQQREYMHEVVFAVPEFVESYHGIGVEPEKDQTFPDVIVDDVMGYPLDLSIQ